jgi:hydroxymethylbilane synthase
MTRAVRIGTRESALALAQARIAAAALRAVIPDLDVQLVPLATAGDRDPHRPMELLESGAFTDDLAVALGRGDFDLAVHSTKDLPLRVDPALPIRSVLRRADPRDAIVSPIGGLFELPAGARVGTSSPNRRRQLLAARPDLVAKPVRGPVDRRLSLIGGGEYDAMLLAAAGLDRLGRGAGIHRLSPRLVVPAPAQGILALQVRADDRWLADLLRRVRHRRSWLAARAERAFLGALRADGDAPVGALARVRRGRLTLLGLADRDDGSLARGTISGPASVAFRLGVALARRLGADRRRSHVAVA